MPCGIRGPKDKPTIATSWHRSLSVFPQGFITMILEMEEGHSIPPEAEEVLERAEPYGDRLFSCLEKGHIVGQRVRSEDGTLLEERTERDGLRHGYERHWDGSGRLTFETWYVEGREHGLARQWHEGSLLGSY